MLIAIMSNTFDRVMEQKQQSAMRERIAILADFRLVLRYILTSSDKFPYIYVINPHIQQDVEPEWDGKLSQMRKYLENTSVKIVND